MIYFDNAATGGFKPRAVTDAVNNVVRFLSANPGRSGHRLSVTGAEIVFDTRCAVADLFGAKPDRVIFTKNCTEALNYAILGLVKRGMHVITTVYEHNSVLRPLFYLKEKGVISLDIVSSDLKNLDVAITEKIRRDTGMIVLNSVSNVTGEVLPVDKIGKIAKENDLYFVVDGAQGGGHVQIDVEDLNITALALACHKGLYGIMGSGALVLSKNADLEPVILGGTGSESFNLMQPSTYPDKLEGGTLNLPAIAALGEGARYVKSNIKTFSKVLEEHTDFLIRGLESFKGVKVYSSPNPSGIVSFSVDEIPSTDVAETLNSAFDVAVRSGIHCAPLLHQYLGTVDLGLTRVSLSAQNTMREIRFFLSAIDRIVKS